ncbi:putative polyketide synthase [Aspergillus crustosus]
MAPISTADMNFGDASITDYDKSLPIAVVGMSFRGPGEATSVENFWDMICERREGWSKVPEEKWNHDAFYHPDNKRHGTLNTKGGHYFSEDLKHFDAPFFNMTSTEAEALDPQQRLLLEGAFEALESGGIPMEKMVGTKTSCFVGSFSGDYTDLLLRDPETVPMYQCTNAGQSRAVTANRISYFFDLKGPSVTIDTACSGSLVALHLACQSLRTGDAKMAVAAGVNTVLSHESSITMSMMRFLSPDGRCYTFDDRANGYARGEGVGILILKPLADALRDKDPIRAVIRGTGTNQDGKTSGLTLPSDIAQEALIRSVYESAGLDPLDTEYVECHGTGTQAGDPQETGALAKVFGSGRPAERPLRIGSVKTNVGHLEGASGLAGAVKAILMLENRILLPNRNFEKLNPKIPLQEWKLKVQLDLEKWETPGTHRISVNSFGYGGSNAHVIFEDARGYLRERGMIGVTRQTKARITEKAIFATPMNGANGYTNGHSNGYTNGHSNGYTNGHTNSISNGFSSHKQPPRRLFVLSGFDEATTKKQAERLKDYLLQRTDHIDDQFLDDLAYTLNERRTNFLWRTIIAGSTVDELTEAISEGVKVSRTAKKPTLGFVFTGQGAQWAGMGKELLAAYPVFRTSMRRIESHLRSIGATFSVEEELQKDPKVSQINKAFLSQPMCTAIQIAVIDLLASWGITPSAVTGHSSGEIGSGYAAGALTMEDAMTLAYYRGAFAPEIETGETKKGAMMAVSMSEEEVTRYLDSLTSGKAVVACVNSPSSMTISGDETAIDELKAKLDEDGVFARKLLVEVAYHSPHMEPAANYYRGLISDIRPSETDEVDFFSSVTGSKLSSTALGPDYWVSNMLGQVKFAHSLRALALETKDSGEKAERKTPKAAVDFLVEIGPHSALGGPIQQILKADKVLEKATIRYGSALVRKVNSVNSILDLASNLLHAGYPVDIAAVNQPQRLKRTFRTLVDLPAYPWNHSNSYWAESRLSKAYKYRKHPRKDLIGAPDHSSNPAEPRWRGHIRTEEIPWVKDHKIQSNIVYPAAGYLTMAIEAALQVAQQEPDTTVTGFSLREIHIDSALVLTEQTASEVYISLNTQQSGSSNPWWTFSISSVTEDNQWTEHCGGLISVRRARGIVDEVTENRESKAEQKKLRDFVAEVEARSGNAGVDVKAFYNHLTDLGLEYGETFANMANASFPSEDTCVAEIVIPDTAKTMPMNHEYPFVIHPSTLDSMFHPLFVALSSKAEWIQDPAVPVSIEEIYVSNDITSTPGHKLKICATATRTDNSHLTASIQAFDSQSDKDADLSIVGLKCKVLPRDEDESTGGPVNQRVAYNIEWRPDVDLLASSEYFANRDPFNTVARYVSLLGHKNPQLSILEVGAGAGVATLAILRALGGENGADARFTHYTYTDKTRDLAEQSAGRLGAWSSLVEFKELDLERDIAAQGFEPHSYDAIIIAHELEQSNNDQVSLRNARSLLKHGGRVVILGHDDRQKQHSELLRTGFSGVDLLVETNGGPGSALIVSSVIDADRKEKEASNREVLLIAESEDEESGVSVAKLTDLFQTAGVHVEVSSFAEARPQGKACIVLSDLVSPLLETSNSDTWEILKTAFLKSDKLLWVTRGGAIVSTNPNAGLVAGFARTARSEAGGGTIVTLDLDGQNVASQEAAAATIFSLFSDRLTAESSSGDQEDVEYAERDGVLLIPRVIEAAGLNSEISTILTGPVATEQPLSQPGRPLRAIIKTAGQLDSIQFSDVQDADSLPADHIVIEVRAASLDKADHQVAIGAAPAATGFGSGVSGVVTAAGPAVRSLKVGDRVTGLGTGTVASHYQGRASLFQKIPVALSFEAAAAIPVAYITAFHVAHNLARITPGDTVFIYDAAQPVGQAVVEFCRLLGATVFASVSTVSEKRHLTQEHRVPDSHIFFSHDGSFAKGLKRMTDGAGVDVVIHAQGGDVESESLRLSWNSIAPFGRFVELDRQSIAANGHLEMANFSRGASFVSFDLRDLLTRKPAIVEDILLKVMPLFRTGALHGPPSLRVFPMSELAQALGELEAGEQFGSVVVNTHPGLKVKADAIDNSRHLLHSDGSYLLVGGLGGIGRAIALWMVDHGATHLIFASRRGLDGQGSKETMRELEARGAHVAVYSCDVSDEGRVSELVETASREMPPIRGVIQAAMVLRDTLLEKLSLEDYTAVLSPKLRGTWNLHNHLPTDLDFFLMLSSVTGVIGNASQTPYAAGNTFLDAFATYRNSLGQAAVSLDLGAISGVGYLAQNKELSAAMQRQRFDLTDDKTLLALIQTAISTPHREGVQAQTLTGLGAWKAGQSLANFDAALFSHFRHQSTSAGAGEGSELSAADLVKEELMACKTLEDASAVVCGALLGKIAAHLDMPVENINPSRSISQYGVDSLVAVEFRGWISRELESTMPILELLAPSSLLVLSEKIASRSKRVNVAAE